MRWRPERVIVADATSARCKIVQYFWPEST
jgi:hypothetical protein